MPRRTSDKYEKKERGRGGRGKFAGLGRKRPCRFCTDKRLRLDYKDAKQVSLFINERGKIMARKYTGACAKHQRDITTAVKRARLLAIVPFTSTQVREFI